MASFAGKPLAEVHGNRTHLPPSSEGTPDLKSGGPTSEPGTSAHINVDYGALPVNWSALDFTLKKIIGELAWGGEQRVVR